MLLPYFNNTNGKGRNTIVKQPSNVQAQSTPRLWNMADAKRGKPEPNMDLMKSLPDRQLARRTGDGLEGIMPTSQHTRSILRISIRLVTEHAVEDQATANRKEA